MEPIKLNDENVRKLSKIRAYLTLELDIELQELIDEIVVRARTQQQVHDQNKLYKWAEEVAPTGSSVVQQAAAAIIREAAGRVGQN